MDEKRARMWRALALFLAKYGHEMANLGETRIVQIDLRGQSDSLYSGPFGGGMLLAKGADGERDLWLVRGSLLVACHIMLANGREMWESHTCLENADFVCTMEEAPKLLAEAMSQCSFDPVPIIDSMQTRNSRAWKVNFASFRSELDAYFVAIDQEVGVRAFDEARRLAEFRENDFIHSYRMHRALTVLAHLAMRE